MIKKNLKEAIEAISKVTNLFYQNKTEEGYKELENTLIVLNNTTSAISDQAQNGDETIVDQVKLNEILMQAMKALEIGDTILFSDIFEYELKELFTEAINADIL
ncbi:MAG: hypothetical protein GX129_05660 [Clostridiales bacterium]|jgi:hypothetical protein|nr:hypothetical protein [Clostridiales bacterium]